MKCFKTELWRCQLLNCEQSTGDLTSILNAKWMFGKIYRIVEKALIGYRESAHHYMFQLFHRSLVPRKRGICRKVAALDNSFKSVDSIRFM